MNVFSRYFALLQFNGKKKAKTFRTMKRLIDAGISIPRVMDFLWMMFSKGGKKPGEPLAMMVKEWQAKYKLGKSLSKSMEGWINPAEQMLLESGEQSEKLSDVLGNLISVSGKINNIRSTIILGAMPPLALFALLFAILWFFSVSVVPAFESVIPKQRWTGMAFWLGWITDFVRNYGLFVAIGFLGLISAALASLPFAFGPMRRYLEFLPPWSLYKVVQGSFFMISLKGFLVAGVSITDALRRMHRIANPYMKERISAIISEVNMGRNLGKAMTSSGYGFPDDEVAREIEAYSGLDGFDEAIGLMAEEWIDDSMAKTSLAMKTFSKIAILLIAGVVLIIFGGMFELQKMMSDMANVV